MSGGGLPGLPGCADESDRAAANGTAISSVLSPVGAGDDPDSGIDKKQCQLV